METTFDAYAQNYERALQAGLQISGENSSFFAAHRIKESKRAVSDLVPHCGLDKAIDFGCGTGNASLSLRESFGFKRVHGLDVSSGSLAVARDRSESRNLQFETVAEYTPSGDADLVFCNGVFHHIVPERRGESLAFIRASLKPGGVFVFWENNPWNPGVHYIMKAIPFDSDAQKILPHSAAKLLRENGFRVLQLRFFFVFPKPLAIFRRAEPFLSRLPLGAQYCIVATSEPHSRKGKTNTPGFSER